ncbi:site-specific DNA-methyltransferase [Prescottella equi]|uniref:DNA-methyltransferase n=1 Tax=Rhodococcus hoagii TaxID=43767 RepID=UPI0019FDCB5A|nr:site-specific DNA-methyltransferase [Prescottella equi]MBM4580877.1 site-specific DNA-methyltransferase [Prescottella equi]MBM4580892.1 site-specific DNA-methyltransferase [Prescottella equi]MBM4580954.1 site-specific DNA-methyltransferase [Prescottella equi]MBM4581427.1 site-specific DNA-methyltransferase [Prescottella equi]MBM4707075.1 site-specific DNA-methyltransferase [Prescottella equi]
MIPYYKDDSVTLHHGDALAVATTLGSSSVDCIVTSPPYFGLRDYGEPGQYGLEATPAEYVETIRALFSELRRVLADDGTLWLNVGDTYSGRADRSAGASGSRGHDDALPERVNTARLLGTKQLLGIPWRVAFALQDAGWILRSEVVWHKPNSQPESIQDRPMRGHEQVFLFSKSRNYWYEQNFDRDVWSVPAERFAGHAATMPVELAARAIRSGCRPGGAVLDPFSGSGTTGLAAALHGRRYIGIDLNATYLDLSLRTRLHEPTLDLAAGRPA